MLSYNTVEPHTLELLKELAKHPLLSEMRLVGGTALALQYGHRSSVDLDFFGALNGDIEDFDDLIASFDSVTRIKETSKIRIYNINGVKVDFVDYSRYECVEEDGIRLASPSDIAAMKINAIEGRGSKKDFIDIYQLLQHYTLSDILEFYKQKYPEHNIFRALMSLSYFDDAEQQPMPKIFNNVSWENIKKTVSANVKQLSI